MIKERKQGKSTIIIVIIIAVLILIMLIFLFLKADGKNFSGEKGAKQDNADNTPPGEKSSSSSADNTSASQKGSNPSQGSDSASSESGMANVMNDLKNKKTGNGRSYSDMEKLIWEMAVNKTKKMIKQRQVAKFPDLNTIGTSVTATSQGTYLVTGFFIFNKAKKYYFQCKFCQDRHKRIDDGTLKIQDHKF